MRGISWGFSISWFCVLAQPHRLNIFVYLEGFGLGFVEF